MNLISFNPVENQNSCLESDILSVFKPDQEKKGEIQEGMSPKEIAEIVSDHLITIVRNQFEIAKREFQAKSND